MKNTQRLIVTLIAIFFGLNVLGATIGVAMLYTDARSNLAAASVQTDQPFDSRACRANPSADTCDGVLPFAPRTSIFDHAFGSGACDDSQFTTMYDSPIQDANNTTVGDLQLWYAPSCQSYTAHLLFKAGESPQGNLINAEVQQFDTSGIFSIISFFDQRGNPDFALPSGIEQTGPVQDSEVWSPLLYSPTAPVRATAIIDAANGAHYAPFSGLATAGHPVILHETGPVASRRHAFRAQ